MCYVGVGIKDPATYKWLTGNELIVTSSLPTPPPISIGADISNGNDQAAYVKKRCNPLPEVKGVKVYNNCAVEVIFADGTKEKAVCDKGDIFNLEFGISICITKRLLRSNKYAKDGTKNYNKAIEKALKVKEREDAAHKKEKEDAEKLSKIKEHQKLKKQKYKERRAKRRAELIAKAMRETGDDASSN